MLTGWQMVTAMGILRGGVVGGFISVGCFMWPGFIVMMVAGLGAQVSELTHAHHRTCIHTTQPTHHAYTTCTTYNTCNTHVQTYVLYMSTVMIDVIVMRTEKTDGMMAIEEGLHTMHTCDSFHQALLESAHDPWWLTGFRPAAIMLIAVAAYKLATKVVTNKTTAFLLGVGTVGALLVGSYPHKFT